VTGRWCSDYSGLGSGADSLPNWVAWAMPVLAALLMLTIVNRVRAGLNDAEPALRSMNQLVGEMTGTPVRSCVERVFTAHDGTVLFFRHWPAASAKPRGAILLFHRGHEHGGRMAHLVEELALPELTFYAWDARGHGRSVDERASSTSFSTAVRDVDEVVRHISSNNSIAIEDISFLAQSVGAVLVATWVHDYAPKIRHGSGLAYVQALRALRAVRAPRSQAHAQAAWRFLRQRLREVALTHA
jgi:alpha-beta hydrolase superfamily lysophospholipase